MLADTRILPTRAATPQGGTWLALHALLGQGSCGDRLLYVGDHTYSDVLMSKRTLGWRTCLVVPELAKELALYGHPATQARLKKLQTARRDQVACDDAVDAANLGLFRWAGATGGGWGTYTNHGDSDKERGGGDGGEGYGEGGGGVREGSGDAEEGARLGGALADALKAQAAAREAVQAASDAWHGCFHPRWGQIFKAGHMDSRFAKQVADYACVYTAEASTLGAVSPTRDFRPTPDVMPHDNA